MAKHEVEKRTVAQIIVDRLRFVNKTQAEIAVECGFEKPNIISMIKTGATKVPLNRIGLLAKALQTDPVHLLRTAMTEYMPDTWQEIEKTLHHGFLTENEQRLVQMFREASYNTDPELHTINLNYGTVFLGAHDPMAEMWPQLELGPVATHD